MIRFLLLSLVSIVSLSIEAQGWSTTKFEKDELKGTSEYTAYNYSENGVGSFIFWDNSEGQFRLITDNGFFNFQRRPNKQTFPHGEDIIVGLYDQDGNLVERIKMSLDCDIDKPSRLETRDAGILNPMGQGKKVRKIMEHLKAGKGYIRFIAELYGGRDFDLKVTCNLY